MSDPVLEVRDLVIEYATAAATPCAPSTASTSTRQLPASWSCCSARRAAARPRCCRCSVASCARPPGSVLVGGVQVDGPRAAPRSGRVPPEDVGFVFQAFNLVPSLTARENVGRTIADSTAWNLAWVSASSAAGSESATIPTPANSRAVGARRRWPSGCDRPRAVAGGVDPADRPGVAAPVDALVGGDPLERRVDGATRHRRRGVQRGDQLEDRGRRLRQPALHQRGQVLHVGHGHDRRLGLGVDVGAPRQEGVPHHVDGDLVLDAVLGRGQQAGGQAGVGGRVAAPGAVPAMGWARTVSPAGRPAARATRPPARRRRR
jgi:hypothetical protein